MAGPCIHGYAPGTCLICQTLDRPERPKVAEAPKATGGPVTSDGPTAATPTRSRARAKPRSGPRVVPKEAPRTSAPAVVKLAGLAVAVVAVIVVAWTVLHLVFAVLHLLELVGVALVAGYLGWVLGVHHGHRTARRE